METSLECLFSKEQKNLLQYSELGEWRNEIGGIGRTSMWTLVISLYFILEAMGSTQVEQTLWCPVPHPLGLHLISEAAGWAVTMHTLNSTTSE